MHGARSNDTNPFQGRKLGSSLGSPAKRACPCHWAPLPCTSSQTAACKAAVWVSWNCSTQAGLTQDRNNSYLLKHVNELERSTKERRETGLGVLWVHRGQMCRHLCKTFAYGLSWGIIGPRRVPVLVHLPQPHVPKTWQGRRLTLLFGCVRALCWVLAQTLISGQGIPAESAIPWLPFSLFSFSLIALLFLPISCLSHTSFQL